MRKVVSNIFGGVVVFASLPGAVILADMIAGRI